MDKRTIAKGIAILIAIMMVLPLFLSAMLRGM